MSSIKEKALALLSQVEEFKDDPEAGSKKIIKEISAGVEALKNSIVVAAASKLAAQYPDKYPTYAGAISALQDTLKSKELGVNFTLIDIVYNSADDLMSLCLTGQLLGEAPMIPNDKDQSLN